jgi:hypothetical protein
MNDMWRRGKPRLPTRPLIGRFAVTDAVLGAVSELLPTYRGPDGDHEGMVFLLGRELTDLTIFVAAAAPDATHTAGSVEASPAAVLAVVDRAHGLGLGLLAQVHSHPAGWSEHSEGDDTLVLMPFEGMLSIVVPHYGHDRLVPLDSLGVHQWQSGRWIACERESVHRGIQVIPTGIDLR